LAIAERSASVVHAAYEGKATCSEHAISHLPPTQANSAAAATVVDTATKYGKSLGPDRAKLGTHFQSARRLLSLFVGILGQRFSLAVNEATGRRITIRSHQRLRRLPAMGCEFCRHAFNRAEGEFTCPYCGKR
jgi:hypothetical protein